MTPLIVSRRSKCASPNKLKLEAFMQGSHKRERELHKLLKKHRIRGEWFRLCPEIEEIIKEVAKPTRVKSLARKGKPIDWDELNEEPNAKRPPPPALRMPPGFTYEALPEPRVSIGFDERLASKAVRKRIAQGDIIFPFRQPEKVE